MKKIQMDDFDNTKTMDPISEKSLQAVKKGLMEMKRISFGPLKPIPIRPIWLKDKDFIAFLNDEFGIKI